jgi:hypothetical protein
MDFGGEMNFTVNGQQLVLRAKFDSEPTNIQVDGGANQDNSLYRTMKPDGWVSEPVFQDLPDGSTLSWDVIIRGGPYNIALNETQTGRLYTWTNAQFEGKPRVDHHTGEVTGLKLRSQSFTKSAA